MKNKVNRKEIEKFLKENELEIVIGRMLAIANEIKDEKIKNKIKKDLLKYV